MSSENLQPTLFRDLGLSAESLSVLDRIGYESPSPIQARAIPVLLKGEDILAKAPTGTGKTAAFALPLLDKIDVSNTSPQVLVLTPTRELAIQVAEAFQKYAATRKGFHVLPLYGGQAYDSQIRQLKRGAHVIVGTPGRTMDHLKRNTLKPATIHSVVLDEADEMLRMGFLEDVEYILEQTPEKRQMALFSATMPRAIVSISQRFLNKPREIAVSASQTSIGNISQRYWPVSGMHKMDALTRILETEDFAAVIIFVRTKTATGELAERLSARGYSAAALNGDMQQKQREQMVSRLKSGSLDILIATDVAARGLDVERITHVINYDIPYDTEAYIHRIGRTGRAGRKGQAILFVSPREKRLFNAIEKATQSSITRLELPTTEMVNNRRIAAFKQQISDTLAAGELGFFENLVNEYQQEHDIPALEIAAALVKISQGEKMLISPDKKERKRRKAVLVAEAPGRQQHNKKTAKPDARQHQMPALQQGMERFRLEVGRNHAVKARNIVGAIANEAGLESQYIGPIEINDDYSLVDLPVGMPREVFRDLKKTWVCGCRLRLSRFTAT